MDDWRQTVLKAKPAQYLDCGLSSNVSETGRVLGEDQAIVLPAAD